MLLLLHDLLGYQLEHFVLLDLQHFDVLRHLRKNELICKFIHKRNTLQFVASRRLTKPAHSSHTLVSISHGGKGFCNHQYHSDLLASEIITPHDVWF